MLPELRLPRESQPVTGSLRLALAVDVLSRVVRCPAGSTPSARADPGNGCSARDHILVSHALVHHVADGAVRTDGSGPTPSITEDPRERRGEPGSDHRPVVAQIDV